MTHSGKRRGISGTITLFIVLPIILVLLLLNTGILQQYLPAVSIGSENYSVAQFHYYFYSNYYEFVNENAKSITEMGLNVNKDLGKQYYDESRTWEQYFKEQAIENMSMDRALLKSAAAEGFTADEAVALACEQREAELTQYCMDNGINGLNKYFSSYYSEGMTQDLYFEMYGNQVLADLYRQSKQDSMAPTQDEISAYAATLDADLADTVNVIVAQFMPSTDRNTGAVEETQWNNAHTLAQKFYNRWEKDGKGEALFLELSDRFGEDDPFGLESGLIQDAFAGDLDDTIATWCFDKGRTEGDVTILQGKEGWYVLYYIGAGADGRLVQAEYELQAQSFGEWLAGLQTGYTIKERKLGMALAL